MAGGVHCLARRAGVLALVAAWVLLSAALPLTAQQLGLPQSAILTLSADRLFSESAFGKRVARDLEADSAVLAAENRKKEAELSAEERDLTDRRSAMEPDAFRALADAFDTKVQDIRREQDAKARDLAKRQDAARREFFQATRPVLQRLMQETGASVILERSSVFLSANATDITDIAINRINAAIGDGTALQPAPDGK